jgi:hypothetical protein
MLSAAAAQILSMLPRCVEFTKIRCWQTADSLTRLQGEGQTGRHMARGVCLCARSTASWWAGKDFALVSGEYKTAVPMLSTHQNEYSRILNQLGVCAGTAASHGVTRTSRCSGRRGTNRRSVRGRHRPHQER